MASGSNKFRLVLSAAIDEKALKTQLDNFKHPLKLKVEIDSAGISQLENKLRNIQSGVSGSAKSGALGNAEDAKRYAAALDAVKSKMAGVKGAVEQANFAFSNQTAVEEYLEDLKRVAGASIEQTFNPNTGALESATAKYINSVGQGVRETIKLGQTVEGTYGYTITQVKATDREMQVLSRREAARIKQIEQERDAYEKLTQQADSFLNKSKTLSQRNPNVARGTAVAGELKNLIGGGMGPSGDPEKIRQLTNELKTADTAIRQAGASAWSTGTQFQVAISRTMQWASAVGLVYGAFRKMQEGIQYIKDLDKEMRNIQVVSNMTDESIDSLAGNFNDLAIAMGVSTKEIASGSLEWIRQGKTVEETQVLMESTLALSKLGALDAAQATEYLTSTLNGFKLGAEEASVVVDKLIDFVRTYSNIRVSLRY